MTKEYLRSTLSGLLRKIDKTKAYHNTFLDHILETCIKQVVYEVHQTNPRALGQYTKRYTAQTITAGGTASRYYHTLTVDLMPLPDKRGGVRSIVASADTDVYFVPVTDQELMLMDESQADALTTTTPIIVYFVVRPDIIEFKNMTSTIAAGTLTLDLIVALTSLADTDDVPLPHGKDMDIMRMALELLGVVPPKDLLDNNADTWQTRRQQ